MLAVGSEPEAGAGRPRPACRLRQGDDAPAAGRADGARPRRTGRSARAAIGSAPVSLGWRGCARRSFPFLRTAAPLVEALADRDRRDGASVGIFQARPDHRPCREFGQGATVSAWRSAKLLPLHATASGIAFLAFTEDVSARPCSRARCRPLRRSPCPARRRWPNRSRRHARAAIRSARKVSRKACMSVAAPILGADGFAIGTIAIAAPQVRVLEGDIERYGASVADAARSIGERLVGRRSLPAQCAETAGALDDAGAHLDDSARRLTWRTNAKSWLSAPATPRPTSLLFMRERIEAAGGVAGDDGCQRARRSALPAGA